MRIESWARSEIGKVRESNQDAIGCFPERGLFVVADGMGGHADGDRASRLAVDLLAMRLDTGEIGEAPSSDASADRLAAAVRDINRSIFLLGHSDERLAHRAMGTTVIALWVELARARATWAHVGDSRLYRLRDATLELLTADHTRFGEPYRTGRPVPLDLPHTNQLIAALGIDRATEVAAAHDVARDGDAYLLCSDGLSGLVRPEQIREGLALDADAASCGGFLLRAALAAGGTDNVSAIVVRLHGA